MKRFLQLNVASVLVLALGVVCRPGSASAVTPVPVTDIIGACDFVLSTDCVSPDDTSTTTSVKIALNKAGVWTATCDGTTTSKPTKAKKCDGEALNSTGTEDAPVDPCGLQLSQNAGTTGPVFTDDWTETISASGNIHLACTFKSTETGK